MHLYIKLISKPVEKFMKIFRVKFCFLQKLFVELRERKREGEEVGGGGGHHPCWFTPKRLSCRAKARALELHPSLPWARVLAPSSATFPGARVVSWIRLKLISIRVEY